MEPTVDRQGRILISGSKGLIARYLMPRLKAERKQVIKLTRKHVSDRKSAVYWNVRKGHIETEKLEQLDAVFHFAGEPIAQRWNESTKAEIYHSRVAGTRLLCEALAEIPLKPQVIVCASAIGIYGDRGDEVLSEDSEPGEGFLAELCRDWEAACQPAIDAGIRVINARFGIVLSANGGALAKMLPVFKAGLGGKLGSGRQFMSWISAQDVVDALILFMKRKELQGPVNVVSPSPVRNADFVRAMGSQLGRPTFCGVPGGMLRLVAGEMADEMLLSSTCVLPKRLLEAGHGFYYEDLDIALKNALRNK